MIKFYSTLKNFGPRKNTGINTRTYNRITILRRVPMSAP